MGFWDDFTMGFSGPTEQEIADEADRQRRLQAIDQRQQMEAVKKIIGREAIQPRGLIPAEHQMELNKGLLGPKDYSTPIGEQYAINNIAGTGLGGSSFDRERALGLMAMMNPKAAASALSGVVQQPGILQRESALQKQAQQYAQDNPQWKNVSKTPSGAMTGTLGGVQGTIPTAANFFPEPVPQLAKLNPSEFTTDSWAKYVKDGDTTRLKSLSQAKSEDEQKKAEGLIKRKSRGAIAKTQNVIKAVDEAFGLVDRGFSSGFFGLTSFVPESPAMALKTKLNTIESNLAFDELSEMRANSKTGGALGQVSEKELVLLKSAWADLNQLNDPEQLKAQLEVVKERYSNFMKTMELDEYGVQLEAGDRIVYNKESGQSHLVDSEGYEIGYK